VGLNLSILLTESARRHPDRVAARLGDTEITYRELDELSNRVVAVLQERGVEPGDRVALTLPNSPQFLACYYGALKAGAVVVPLNPLLKARELGFALADSGAKVLVAWREFFAEARAAAGPSGVGRLLVAGGGRGPRPVGATTIEEAVEWIGGGTVGAVPRDPGEPAVIVYTSGTTGGPKGAVLTHSGLVWNAHLSAEAYDLSERDSLFAALPFFHVAGQSCVMNAAIYAGARLALMQRFEPQAALELAEEERVSVLTAVPTMWGALLAAERARDRPIPTPRVLVTGAASIADEVRQAIERRFGRPLVQIYGLTECSGAVALTHPGRASAAGSVGSPLWGVETKVVGEDGRELPPGEVGEVLVRGHCLMASYHGNPSASIASAVASGLPW